MIKFCNDCKYAKPEPGFPWNLRCHNPEVNKEDPWALAGSENRGTLASEERAKGWLKGVCGKRGAKYEPIAS